MERLMTASAIAVLTLGGWATLAAPSWAQGAISPFHPASTIPVEAAAGLFVGQDAQAPLAPGASADDRAGLRFAGLEDEIQAPLTMAAGLEGDIQAPLILAGLENEIQAPLTTAASSTARSRHRSGTRPSSLL